MVLPKYNAVVTMTSIMSPAGGLRDAQRLQILRYMMTEYILPALDHQPSTPTEAQKKTLLDELQLAEDSKGVPGLPSIRTTRMCRNNGLRARARTARPFPLQSRAIGAKVT